MSFTYIQSNQMVYVDIIATLILIISFNRKTFSGAVFNQGLNLQDRARIYALLLQPGY